MEMTSIRGERLLLPNHNDPMSIAIRTHNRPTISPHDIGHGRSAIPQTASPYQSYKSGLEFLIAFGLFLFAAPVMLLAAILVKLTSRGPAFYSQTRLGLGGLPYTIYKLRSMCDNCEKHTGARWSMAGDTRITPIGKLLRRTHLDELPQLWNVLRGDMSLVGPRPERPEFIPVLASAIPLYHARLQVRPGVTGLAQVQLPPDTDLESVKLKLSYDLFYVRHIGFWLDMRLILATALHLGGIPYVWLGKALALPRGGMVEKEYRDLTAQQPHIQQKSKATVTEKVAVAAQEPVAYV